MNKHIKRSLWGGAFLVVFIFVFPLLLPQWRADYADTTKFLIPIAVALFLIPAAAYHLRRWDIRFHFTDPSPAFQVTVANLGDSQFNFNRVAFASRPRYRIFGARKTWPTPGIFYEDIVVHGADTPSQTLHEHIGCT